MIAPRLIRRYALNQQIDLDVADQEIVLHYALELLNRQGLLGRLADGSAGPLLSGGLGADRVFLELQWHGCLNVAERCGDGPRRPTLDAGLLEQGHLGVALSAAVVDQGSLADRGFLLPEVDPGAD